MSSLTAAAATTTGPGSPPPANSMATSAAIPGRTAEAALSRRTATVYIVPVAVAATPLLSPNP